jgi:CubicO group peptidase (beta-lactamase class C family)
LWEKKSILESQNSIMKKLLYILAAFIVVLAVIIGINYEKLNILSGYAAKNASSVLFLADRSFESLQDQDNNFSPINLASVQYSEQEQSASASVFGLMKRTAINRPGLGSALLTEGFDPSTQLPVPNRKQPELSESFPYGNGRDKDSLMAGVDYERLRAVVREAFDQPDDEIKRQTRTVLVVYKDQIIAEQYADGFDKNTRVLGWSMTKSLQATMIGIMAERTGFDIQAPAPIQEWSEDERAKITTHNLLQMNSGLSWVEDYNTISDVTQMLFMDADMTMSQIRQKALYQPDTHWNYSSGTTNVLSRILRQQFPDLQSYLDFPYESFIDRIGMYSMLIETDLVGHYVGSSYGWANTRDWAKFGLLYLHRGNWNGEQIFQSDWVDYVVQPTPDSEGTYGAQFWLNAQGGFKNLPRNMFSCNGYQGQRVAIFPDQDLVVVRTGLGDEDVFSFENFYEDILACLPKE